MSPSGWSEAQEAVERELQSWANQPARIFDSVGDMNASAEDKFRSVRDYRKGSPEDGFDFYINSDGRYVAYKCPRCEKVVTGPPLITTSELDEQRRGREGLDFYCGNCNEHIYEFTLRMSD
ncbi:MAG: hypothetical protein AABX14_02655 [Candidatus Aenigmatarchaeota archaeon]